ncbi:hypothetical protein EDC04DRAFT_3095303, partial [Pisolithus marmoratus]
MAKEMANLMALARKPATKLQQTSTSLGEPRKWSNTTLRWVVAPTAIVAAARVMLEVEFAGGDPAGGTSEDGVHIDCKVALAVEVVVLVVVALYAASQGRGVLCSAMSMGGWKSGRASSVGVDSIGQPVLHNRAWQMKHGSLTWLTQLAGEMDYANIPTFLSSEGVTLLDTVTPSTQDVITRRSAAEFDDGYYVDHGSHGSSSGAEDSLANAPRTSSDVGMDAEGKLEEEQDGKPYALRRRPKINYAGSPPLGELKPPPPPRIVMCRQSAKIATALLGVAYGGRFGALPTIVIDWFGLELGIRLSGIAYRRERLLEHAFDAHTPHEVTNSFPGVGPISSERQCLLGRECCVEFGDHACGMHSCASAEHMGPYSAWVLTGRKVRQRTIHGGRLNSTGLFSPRYIPSIVPDTTTAQYTLGRAVKSGEHDTPEGEIVLVTGKRALSVEVAPFSRSTEKTVFGLSGNRSYERSSVDLRMPRTMSTATPKSIITSQALGWKRWLVEHRRQFVGNLRMVCILDSKRTVVNGNHRPSLGSPVECLSHGLRTWALYYESQSEEDRQDPSDFFSNDNHLVRSTRRSHQVDDDEDEDDQQPRRATRSQSSKRKTVFSDFIVSDEEESKGYSLRQRRKPPPPPPPRTLSGRISRQPQRYIPSAAATVREQHKRSTRYTRRSAAELDDGYVDPGSDGSSSDAEDAEGKLEAEQDSGPYALRRRTKINYAVPPPLEEFEPPPPPRNHNTGGRGGKKRGPGWSASGAELSRWMGIPLPADDSDSDVPLRTPRKNFGDGALLGAGAMSAGGLLPSDFAAATAGTPSNLGKIGESALADADPPDVNQNVTFDEVGGLDDHIHALKEMTLLPLLYPEVFQRFGLTPPRGVLFHGPPGTGKTLLARALAASTRSNGKGISFFMRKGADCLSKWVGEAERQLRLLFEEARTCQPSIFFFDEIDGLAPVRSSKQDQIHASIVSTLLALMDGMDGRGQVIVIGATNRPDAVDPALRRPGRFDREFYFPLPTVEARERILGIMTRKWENWQGEKGAENVKGLARMTKGYSRADLRALCTEAALNAIQRRYPQIYQSNDRLLLKPETIGVSLRDFMIAIPKLVPSSARSTSTSASPLPAHLMPLLGDALERVKSAIDRVLPVSKKKRSALEEAEWEDRNGEEDALEREMLIHGNDARLSTTGDHTRSSGDGSSPYRRSSVVSFGRVSYPDVGLGNADGGFNKAVVQLFVEAKRHPPSVMYVPALSSWCAAVSETTRSTVRAMLESLSPTDPVLLLAVADGPLSSLPQDVKVWFGITRGCRIALDPSTSTSREAFFAPLIADIRRPPNAYPDGIARRKRVLEVLPLAPPPEPRQPSAAELALQVENDRKVMTVLKYRLGPILTELKRKFKRFTKRAREEYDFDAVVIPTTVTAATAAVDHAGGAGGTGGVTEVEIVASNVVIQDMDGIVEVTNEKVQEVHHHHEVNGIVGDAGSAEHYHDDAHIHGGPSSLPVVPPTHPVLPQGQAQAQLQLPPPSSQPYHNKDSRNNYKTKLTHPNRYHRNHNSQNHNLPFHQLPRLYDMDLERMHLDLYKDKYLTPQDFLDDIRKMVHNATVYAHVDGDRLHKAQAMLTAAEMSVLEFDPQLRWSVGGWLEERKKEREKEKENGNGGEQGGNVNGNDTYAPGTRRSARHNGQQPEIQITDPLQLERRLKRARSAGEMSGGSPDTGPGDDKDRAESGTTPRQQKRARTVSSEDGDHDPIDMIGPSQQRHAPVVRFANGGQPVQEDATSTFVSAQPPQQPRDYHLQRQHVVQNGLEPDAMAVDYHQSTSSSQDNVNPFLVASPIQPQPEKIPTMSISRLLNGDTRASSLSRNPTPTPSPLPPPQQQQQNHELPYRRSTPTTHSPPRTPVRSSADPTPSQPSAESMVVSPPPREPSHPPTPLPDFHVDEELVSTLQYQLMSKTDQFSVEMLEQLRAICLGCVWRHRKEWNRDALVREFMGVLDEYLDDAAADVGDALSAADASFLVRKTAPILNDNTCLDGQDEEEEEEEDEPVTFTQTSRGRRIKRAQYYESQSEEDRQDPTDLFSNDNHLVHNEEESKGYSLRQRRKPPPPPPPKTLSGRISRQPQRYIPSAAATVREQHERSTRNHTSFSSPNSTTAIGFIANAPRTSSDVGMDQDAEGEPDPDAEGELEAEQDGRPYALHRRTKINYAVPPPLEELKPPPPPRNRNAGGRAGKKRGPGWSASGAELSRWMGIPLHADDSNFGGGALLGAGAMSAGGLLPDGVALADADPLGVNLNVTFEEVGGLDDEMEMTLLPLLYPEVFQRFGLTPPRGCTISWTSRDWSNGKGISFFMRKGADCLSKWVGEAERQLRLLFEEARTCQPSIIFFDEIDGLATVRSSKQDQIHASIVSTLLALMDGMDGRGQVIVIGATNRPDAVDPALRRPGRFDREFYFPLPTVEARERILGIMTRKWENWQGEKGAENVKGLARMTKGYGGADLRALCTEAALNAIQRRYPQIYQSNDRLLLKPETIGVSLRDFMIAIPKLVPSSARSTSTSQSPLSAHLAPLLGDALERSPTGVEEEAVGTGGGRVGGSEREEDALEREMLMQSMETMRVYRPRVILHGPAGMGQAHIGAAALYHLEGCHIQTLDLGTLMEDSTRTPEAAIVHYSSKQTNIHPSVIYISALSSGAPLYPKRRGSTDVKFGSALLVVPYRTDPTTSTSREAFFAPLIADIRHGIARRKRVLEVLPLAPPPEPRQPSAAELALQVENDRKVMTVLKYRLGPILTELKRKFKRFTKRAREEYDFDAVVIPTTVTAATAAADHAGGVGGAGGAGVTEVEIVASNVVIQGMDGIVE